MLALMWTGHAKENGAFQNGVVILKRKDGIVAFFSAFQTQMLPTSTDGRPDHDAKPLPEYIRS